MAITNDDKIILVKQFRKSFEKAIYEIPAGKLEKGEEHYTCGVRELEEETGYISDNWVKLGYIYTSVGFCDEKLHLYLARDLKYKKQNPDEDEIIECEEYPLSTVMEMIDNGVINDAKSICTILRARKYLSL